RHTSFALGCVDDPTADSHARRIGARRETLRPQVLWVYPPHARVVRRRHPYVPVAKCDPTRIAADVNAGCNAIRVRVDPNQSSGESGARTSAPRQEEGE